MRTHAPIVHHHLAASGQASWSQVVDCAKSAELVSHRSRWLDWPAAAHRRPSSFPGTPRCLNESESQLVAQLGRLVEVAVP